MDSEHDLVVRAQDGDREAFDQLITLYQAKMIRVAARLVGQFALEWDVVQEAVGSAWAKLRAFRAGSDFGAWICTITANQARDMLRRIKGRKEDEFQEELHAPVTYCGSQSDKNDAAFKEEVCAAWREVVKTMSHEEKRAFVLRFFVDLKTNEVAGRMNITIVEVHKIVTRVRRRVLTALKSLA